MSDINTQLDKVGMPNLVFMFTVDQMASMLNIDEKTVMSQYLFYLGRSTGVKSRHHMQAVNIAPADQKPDWRVSLEEYRKWLRRMGFTTNDISRL